MNLRPRLTSILGALVLLSVPGAQAQSSLVIYGDSSLGFQNWGSATVSFTNQAPVHSWNNSISMTITSGSAGNLNLEHLTPFDTSLYTSLSFWIHGGSSGGQKLRVYARLDGGTYLSGSAYTVPPLASNTWQQIIVPLATLSAANRTNLTGFVLEGTTGGAQPTFYVDDITLVAAPAPALVHLTADAAAPVRTADARWFGVNTGGGDSMFDTLTTSNALKQMGCRLARFPGGSGSDSYHWATDPGPLTWARFMHMVTNMAGAQAIITVNYGTGTSNEAAAWVLSANVTNRCGFKYWEIGNECFGSWETDSHTPAHDPYTYALEAANYISTMKQADPTIKIGVVACAREDDSVNNTTHPATNPRTGQVHNGWTPVMLTTLKSLGVTPDFVIYHYYPEGLLEENDTLLLQSTRNWPSDAASLRQQLTDYLGAAGTNTEMVVTENNSDTSHQGKQSTSVVNGLYLADSLAHIMQTEFNAYVWWCLHLSQDTKGSFDPFLYGWRNYGTMSIMNYNTCTTSPDFLTNCYPTYHAFSLMQHLVQAGDTVIQAASDYALLPAYAVFHTNGTLSLLVINKDPTATFNAQIALTNFVPSATATVYSYGIPQDEAARTNATPAAQGVAGPADLPGVSTPFTNVFPPYSLTLFTFAPAAGLLPPGGLLASAGLGQVALSWSAAAGVTNYNVKRSLTSGGTYATLAGSVTGTNYTDTGLTNNTTYYYVISAVNGEYESANSSEVSATPGFLLNLGFETPHLSTYQYNPTGGSWTFTPQSSNQGSGISANGSDFTRGNTNAPQGVQVAFLQGASTISQPVTGLAPGAIYQLTFSAAQRNNIYATQNGQTWNVTIDGNVIASYAPSQTASNYVDYAATFTASAAGSHTLAFVGTNTRGGDNTIFLDNIRFVPFPSTVPPQVASQMIGGCLDLSWPAASTGWLLQAQTNFLPTGLSTIWVSLPASVWTNQVLIPIDSANPSAFFRLIWP